MKGKGLELEKNNVTKLKKEGSSWGLTRDILLCLAAGTLIVFAVAAVPAFGYILGGINEENFRKKKKGRLTQALKRLEKQKNIKWVEKEGKYFLIVTKNGKKKILKYQIDEMKLQKPKEWDGKIRMVAFDIPEKNKGAREMLRKKLRDLGFFQLQRSVFLTPFECREEIDFLKSYFEITPYMHYVVVSEIADFDIKVLFKAG